MKWFQRTAALVLAVSLSACGGASSDQSDQGGGASSDRTTREARAETPVSAETPVAGGVIQHLGDNRSTAASTPTPPPDRNVRNVIINDVRLSDDEILELEQRYRVQIVDANYWYDSVSGAWGLKGGPMRGVVLPGLQLGGPLKADASGRAHTGTFVNGRELHPLDVDGLNRCTRVQLGRFWVRADGWGGLEGYPPSVNLYTLCGGGGGGKYGWVCDGGSCGTARTVTGPNGVVSEGGGQAGIYTGQGLILTPN